MTVLFGYFLFAASWFS